MLMILGDLNIHVDDATDSGASKLSDILASHSLHQHMKSLTHISGHTLDLFITRDDLPVAMSPIDPPLLSDHSFIVAECASPPPSSESAYSRLVRNWHSLDIDVFVAIYRHLTS